MITFLTNYKLRFVLAFSIMILAAWSREDRNSVQSKQLPDAERPQARQSTTKDEIQEIKDRYTAIKLKLPTYRKVERKLMDFSTEGGTLNAYFDGGKINLIVVTLYGETGRSDEEYYYDDSGNLFFVLRKESRYDGPFGKTVSVRENRFYFREGELIQWLDNEKKRVPSDSAEYKRQEENLLEFSKTLAETAQLPGVKSSEPSTSEQSPVAEPLRSVLAEIKNQTNVPILLPSELPYTLAKQNIYAIGEAVNGGYEISLISRPQCGANSCFIASFKAQRGGNMRHPEETDDDPQSEDKRVVLVNNTKAYYKPLTCGGSCSPPIIEWVSNGVLYTIQFEVEWRTNLTQSEEERLMVEVANSAIKHGAR